MGITVDELTTKAMTLPSEYRAQLAEKLVEGLEYEKIENLWIHKAKK